MERADMPAVKKAIKLAIEKGYPFYVYSMPGSMTINMELSIKTDPLDGQEWGASGFILAPFSTKNNKALFIKNELAIQGEKELQELSNMPYRQNKKTPEPNTVTTYEEYMKGARYLIETLKQNKIKKAVYSRTYEYKSPAQTSAPYWFETIYSAYPAAFRFLVSVPGVTIWMGATPELLLKYHNSRLHTMALAATRATGETRNWSKKEEEEQQIVTRYIKAQFQQAGIEPEISPREEIQAGPVTHLCNKISAKNITPDQARELLSKLHPTPAVCGVPAEKAARMITTIENRDRRYYSGYLGPVENDKSFSLFVNLRSMELFRESAQLYAGGGYTADSDPMSEWQETEHKIKTLLSCIDKKDEYYNR